MISVIIPAFREADRVGRTLDGVLRGAEALGEPLEVVVVDDGSDDGTAEEVLALSPCPRLAPSPAVRLVRLERNRGKGAALARGLTAACGEWIVMLDADLGDTAGEFPRLLAPVRAGQADMTIALFSGARRQAPDARRQPGKGGRAIGLSSPGVWRLAPGGSQGGFGLALRTARWGVARLTGRVLKAPLSGQRAFAAAHLPRLLPLESGFGLEVGLDIDALRAGLRVLEVPTGMAHAATGRDWAGFRHRGRQMAHILRALVRRAVRGSRR